MKLYAIANEDGKLAGWECRGYEDYGGSIEVSFSIDFSSNLPWITTSKEIAQKVMESKGSSWSFGGDYDFPGHDGCFTKVKKHIVEFKGVSVKKVGKK